LNDDMDNVKQDKEDLERSITNFITNELNLYNSYCGDPNEFPVYDLATAQEPECAPDFSENLTRCLEEFRKKYLYHQKHSKSMELCNEWEKNLQCKREEISKCNFKTNLNMLISGIGNAVQDNHLRSTFCGK
jgi:hypothetical protein